MLASVHKLNAVYGNKWRMAMLAQLLVSADINQFLARLSSAIELDQVYVDSLLRERFSSMYYYSLWRGWRRDHRAFIDKLVMSADAVSSRPPAVFD